MNSELNLSTKLDALEQASRAELIKHWRRFYRSDPPRYASSAFLVRAAAYATQEQEFGGLPTLARRQLLAVAKGEPLSALGARITIKPGTRLLREWHGTTHEVIVTDKGFVLDGATHRSLSAVAHAITGAKWNGHRFFGLSKRAVASHG